MNKKSIRTTSFLLFLIMLAATFIVAMPKISAHADETQTVYPESFISEVELTSLTDYAVGVDGYLFIDSGYLYHYIRGASANASSYIATGIEAKACDYIDGSYYYTDVTDTTRTFSDNQPSSTTIRSFDRIDIGDYIYNFWDGKYYAWDGLVTTVEIAGISKLKMYSNILYCISNGAIATVSGVTVTENAVSTLQYLNYGLASTMPTLDLAETLKATDVSFVTIAVGAYMTELDIEDLGGEYLSVGQTVVSSGGTALLLASSGNAAVILLDGNTYICLTSVTTATTLGFEQTAAFNYAKVNLLGGAVYSTTFASPSTQIEVLGEGTSVTVVSICSSMVFGDTFYKVSYTVGETERSGYIPTAFLTEAEYIEDGDKEVSDPNYQVDSLVQRVILIVAIIMLILIAAIYLVHIGTRPKKKGKKVKSEDKLKEDNEM